MTWLANAPRSLLFVPGDRADELFRKAVAANPDAIVLDLEDSVAPSAKDSARERVKRAVTKRDSGPLVYVRLSGMPDHTPSDLALAAAIGASAVIVPKADDPADLERIGTELVTLRSNARVMALVETAAGLLAASALAAVPSVLALILGAEDLRLDLGARPSRSGREILYARSLLVAAARGSHKWAFDTICTDVARVGNVAREARLARNFGFDGKLAIHPRQVEPINAAFTPTATEVADARNVVAAFDAALRGGHGVAVLHGRMLDAPIVESARRVLERAERASLHGTRHTNRD